MHRLLVTIIEKIPGAKQRLRDLFIFNIYIYRDFKI